MMKKHNFYQIISQIRLTLIIGIAIYCLEWHMPAYSQKSISTIFKENRQFVGVQFNPYISSVNRLWETSYYPGSSKSKVFTLRYGNEVIKNLYA
jgi:hypothetical protein